MTNANVILRGSVLVSLMLAMLVIASGVAAADSHVWTTQADFQAGTLTEADATASPGNLSLQLDPTSFSAYAGNPIFTPSAGWDNLVSIPGTVLQFGATYVMWYTGGNSSGGGIGRAVSTDGIHWTRNPTTPLLATSSSPVVRFESGVYKMWYEHGGAYQPTYIYYATSADGISWTPYPGNPVLAPAASGFDSYIVFPGGVLHDVTGYRMWYGASDGVSLTYATGLATSSDGINWTRYGGNPIITPPFGGWWDSERVLPSVVLPWNGQLLMGYVGTDSSFTQRIALATSVDGIHWTPHATLTLDIGPSGSWDAVTLSHLSLLPVAGNLTMWYGGSPSAGAFQTGVAYAPAYAPQGMFQSAVFDSGANGTTWSNLRANATTPPSTQVFLSARSGNGPVPATNWSSWVSIPSPGGALAIPRSRYVQVGATLLTADGSRTPILADLTLTYQGNRAAAPTLNLPAQGAWTANTTGTFEWTFVDPDTGDQQSAYELQISADSTFATLTSDTGHVISNATQALLSLPPVDGVYFWRVRTQDNWGLWGPYTAASMFQVDRTPPAGAITWGSPSVVANGTRYVSSQTPITLSASDGMGIGTALILYSIDNGIPAIYSVPFRANESDGQHYLRFSAVDLLGNIMAPLTVPFVLDNTGPTTSLGVTAAGTGFQVTVASSDAGSGVAAAFVSVDGSPWAQYTGPLTLENAGSHLIRAYAVDRLGNQGATQTTTVVIANMQPYLAGAIGLVGLVMGILLARRAKALARASATLSAVLGAAGLAIGITSAGTGTLAIPPWAGITLVLDAALAAATAILLALAGIGLRKTNRGEPPPSPGGTGNTPQKPA